MQDYLFTNAADAWDALGDLIEQCPEALIRRYGETFDTQSRDLPLPGLCSAVGALVKEGAVSPDVSMLMREQLEPEVRAAPFNRGNSGYVTFAGNWTNGVRLAIVRKLARRARRQQSK